MKKYCYGNKNQLIYSRNKPENYGAGKVIFSELYTLILKYIAQKSQERSNDNTLALFWNSKK